MNCAAVVWRLVRCERQGENVNNYLFITKLPSKFYYTWFCLIKIHGGEYITSKIGRGVSIQIWRLLTWLWTSSVFWTVDSMDIIKIHICGKNNPSILHTCSAMAFRNRTTFCEKLPSDQGYYNTVHLMVQSIWKKNFWSEKACIKEKPVTLCFTECTFKCLNSKVLRQPSEKWSQWKLDEKMW